MKAEAEIYTTEMRHQEMKSNQRTLMGFALVWGMVTFIWILTMVRFFLVDRSMITVAWVASSALFAVAAFLCWKTDLSAGWEKYVFIALVCVLCAIVSSILTIHVTLIYVLPLLFAVHYRKRRVLWFAFGLDTVGLLVSSFLGFYFGICDLNILFDSGFTREEYLTRIIDSQAVSLTVCDNVTTCIALYEVLPRAMILFVFTVMLHQTIVSSREDAVRIARLTYHKDTDRETRLYNKGKFDEMSLHYYPKVKQVEVAFFDLNNLKWTNDTYGHAAGDVMINALSQVLLSVTGKKCKAYRIGGDEFLLVLERPLDGEMRGIQKEVQNQLQKSARKEMLPISVAVGIASGSGKEIEAVVKMADEKMYEDKKRKKDS